MYKTAYFTGYKPFELNIFNDNCDEVKYLKKFIRNKLITYIEEGLEWVLTQGQLGIEMWVAQTVIELKEEYPQIKLGIITPFEEVTAKWNEENTLKFEQVASKADYVNSIYHAPYQGPHQFKACDQFMLDHTDLTIMIYDDEMEGSPKYFKRLLVDFVEKTNYTYDIVTFDEITDFINDLQWSNEQ
ncbi:DUF1273 domain-containing protein [Staphylococcus massiliensis]|uniref:UPF0398 protein C273_07257 n=1 Tax=Staphylococcus massiliensis S46 TaxID=1229783 RepID=K9AN55_9STAP|nr:DUF1273 domain-containing protein [Staphylococcus massiliensis]EKU47476.1 hypothetical protein C273_07257 [Staphylococcus massiliensis S46]MCG3398881.1 DUF1273 domain-containing protein [Staphylococcus massiliensis]MCG3401116.1 DUF1273 domain-containing protein [Staphylococcus massiliensis]MCG3412252.1 DUF1273 domain-containing protein [Staphylococcus massiliensis]POA01109.1 DUF1273 domain-containing protein [Staphylococcus massiliensis CCUG 55927]